MTGPGPVPDPVRLRIGDAERQAAAEALAEHYAAGRIDAVEHDERVERVWRARTGADLAPVFADLPGPAAYAPAVRPAPYAAVRSRGARHGHHGPPAPMVLALLLVLAVVLHLPLLLALAATTAAFVVVRRMRGPGGAGPVRSLRSRT